MQTYIVTDLTTGDTVLAELEHVAKLIGVEANYIGWCIDLDGIFASADWHVSHQF